MECHLTVTFTEKTNLHLLVLSSLQLHLGCAILGFHGIKDVVVPPKLHLCHIIHVHLCVYQHLVDLTRHQCTPGQMPQQSTLKTLHEM